VRVNGSFILLVVCLLVNLPLRSEVSKEDGSLVDTEYRSPYVYFFSVFDWEARRMLEGGDVNGVYGMLHSKVDSVKNDGNASRHVRGLGNGHYLMVRTERNRVMVDLMCVADWKVEVLSRQEAGRRVGRRMAQGKRDDEELYVVVTDEWGNVKQDAIVDFDGDVLKWSRRFQCYTGQSGKKKGWLNVTLDGVTRYVPLIRTAERKQKGNNDERQKELSVSAFVSSHGYHDGDSIRYKFLIKNGEGKRFNKPLDVYLTSETEYWLATLKPMRDGVYVGDFQIADSMTWYTLGEKRRGCDFVVKSEDWAQSIQDALVEGGTGGGFMKRGKLSEGGVQDKVRIRANVRPSRNGRVVDVRVMRNGKAESGADVTLLLREKEKGNEGVRQVNDNKQRLSAYQDIRQWIIDSVLMRNSHCEFLMKSIDKSGLLGRLDSVESYRFSYPDTPMYVNKTQGRLTDFGHELKTEFAPFVFINGQQQAVHAVYVDGTPAYLSLATDVPYSIRIVPGRHRIYVRTDRWLYDLGIIETQNGTKTVVSIDGSRFKDKIAFDDTLSNVEKMTIYPTLMNVVHAEENAYLMQNGVVFKLQASGDEEQNYQMKIGPLKPHVPVHYISGNKRIIFEYVPYGNYSFGKDRIERTLWKDTAMSIRLNAIKPKQEIGDSALTEYGIIDELQSENLALQAKKRKKFFPSLLLNERDSSVVNVVDDTSLVEEGYLKIETEKLAGNKRFRLYRGFLDMIVQNETEMDDDFKQLCLTHINKDLDVLAYELDSLSLDYDTIHAENRERTDKPNKGKPFCGFVKDAHGNAIANAAVVNCATGEMYRTDFSGFFTIEKREAGTMSLRIMAKGFYSKRLTVEDVDDEVRDVIMNKRIGDYVTYRPLFSRPKELSVKKTSQSDERKSEIIIFESQKTHKISEQNRKWMLLPLTDTNGRVQTEYADWIDNELANGMEMVVVVTLRDGSEHETKLQ